MNHYIHHALIVFCVEPNPTLITKVESWRSSLPSVWQPLIVGPVSGVEGGESQTWVFMPDGAKKGFRESEFGNVYRKQFCDFFTPDYEVVEVTFGQNMIGDALVPFARKF